MPGAVQIGVVQRQSGPCPANEAVSTAYRLSCSASARISAWLSSVRPSSCNRSVSRRAHNGPARSAIRIETWMLGRIMAYQLSAGRPSTFSVATVEFCPPGDLLAYCLLCSPRVPALLPVATLHKITKSRSGSHRAHDGSTDQPALQRPLFHAQTRAELAILLPGPARRPLRTASRVLGLASGPAHPAASGSQGECGDVRFAVGAEGRRQRTVQGLPADGCADVVPGTVQGGEQATPARILGQARSTRGSRTAGPGPRDSAPRPGSNCSVCRPPTTRRTMFMPSPPLTT